MDKQQQLDLAQRSIQINFAPWMQSLKIQVTHLDTGCASLRLAYAPELSHADGCISSAIYIALADTAMSLAAGPEQDQYMPLRAGTLNTSFVRLKTTEDLVVHAQILRRGKSLIFGEVKLEDASGDMLAHNTNTYVL